MEVFSCASPEEIAAALKRILELADPILAMRYVTALYVQLLTESPRNAIYVSRFANITKDSPFSVHDQQRIKFLMASGMLHWEATIDVRWRLGLSSPDELFKESQDKTGLRGFAFVFFTTPPAKRFDDLPEDWQIGKRFCMGRIVNYCVKKDPYMLMIFVPSLDMSHEYFKKLIPFIPPSKILEACEMFSIDLRSVDDETFNAVSGMIEDGPGLARMVEISIDRHSK